MTQSVISKFYNRYHRKNAGYTKLINDQNFTYFFLQKLIRANLPGKAAAPGTAAPSAQVQILDVGCGVGTVSLWLASHSYQVTGVDISTRAIKIARSAQRALGLSNVTFTQADLSQAKQTLDQALPARRHFDLIIASEIIEHLSDPSRTVQALISRLKPGGRLLITTPSPHNLSYRWGWLTTFDRQVGHLRRFTEPELRQLVTGTRPQASLISLHQTQGPLRSALYIAWGGRLGWLIKFLRGPLVPAFHWVDDALARLWGFFDWEMVVEKNSNTA